jgi:hypothetical protein
MSGGGIAEVFSPVSRVIKEVAKPIVKGVGGAILGAPPETKPTPPAPSPNPGPGPGDKLPIPETPEEVQAEGDKAARRATSGAAGRQATILTSSTGEDEEDITVSRRTLLGS